jgi:rod shape-determining protein MreD
MKGVGGVIIGLVCLWVGDVLQLGLASHLNYIGSPDFPLIFAFCLGLFTDRRGACLLGFGAGLVSGALTGADITLFVLTRTLIGFLIGWFSTLDLQLNVAVAAFAVIFGSLAVQLLFLFLGGHHGPLTSYLGGTLASSVYNGVIAVPVYALLNKVVAKPVGDRM